MTGSACEQLDAYLDRALTDRDRTAFEGHLSQCGPCRQAVEEQARLAQLLQQATAELEPIPTGLAERIDRRLRAAHRRRVVRWAGGLAAAAVVLALLVGGWLGTRTPDALMPTTRQVEAPPEPAPPEPNPPAPAVTVAFPGQSDVLAVPIKTDNPNVTIIWVYPALKPTAQLSADGADLESDF
jgi:anti-sigma factor RsiW